MRLNVSVHVCLKNIYICSGCALASVNELNEFVCEQAGKVVGPLLNGSQCC